MISAGEKTRSVRAKRHAAGLCWYCTQPIAPSSKGTCEEHLKRRHLAPAQTTWTPGRVGRPPEWAKRAGLVSSKSRVASGA